MHCVSNSSVNHVEVPLFLKCANFSPMFRLRPTFAISNKFQKNIFGRFSNASCLALYPYFTQIHSKRISMEFLLNKKLQCFKTWHIPIRTNNSLMFFFVSGFFTKTNKICLSITTQYEMTNLLFLYMFYLLKSDG